MPGLSDHKIEIVRHLVESAPDKIVGGLQNALSAASGDSALAGVRQLVESEMADRRLRNAVLAPVAPLFFGDGKLTTRLVFPARALALIWRGLKAEAPGEVALAARIMADFRPDETSPEPLDALVARAAEGLRNRESRDFIAAADCLDAVRPGCAYALAACLDIGAIVRAATLRLPDWITRTTDERAAAARLAYKDAITVSEDAAPRFFEMLSAQMAEPWTILRIVSAVMDHPAERYLAASELSIFALRVMDQIDQNLTHIAKFDLDGGAKSGKQAATVVELVTRQIAEMEGGIELATEGGWGGRVKKQKGQLAGCVEGRLREVGKLLGAALPTQQVKVARMSKELPRFTTDPEPRAIERAMAVLTFVEAIRTSSNYGGFASTRAKVLEKAAEQLDFYVEESLALVRDGSVRDFTLAASYLEVAANCAALIREPRAGDIVRRRTAVAVDQARGLLPPEPPAAIA
ncbi:hypothetical protein [Phenylobacterium aquaticum]|uniref:hypothetical protein n=1 Tax=Phenylobacterium aquaticum TaxID=1763816 RepID=UPI0026EABB00|nr:hypothetical protein [Phenylobacterium aquaticum]